MTRGAKKICASCLESRQVFSRCSFSAHTSQPHVSSSWCLRERQRHSGEGVSWCLARKSHEIGAAKTDQQGLCQSQSNRPPRPLPACLTLCPCQRGNEEAGAAAPSPGLPASRCARHVPGGECWEGRLGKLGTYTLTASLEPLCSTCNCSSASRRTWTTRYSTADKAPCPGRAARWLEHHPVHQKVAGSIPVQRTHGRKSAVLPASLALYKEEASGSSR